MALPSSETAGPAAVVVEVRWMGPDQALVDGAKRERGQTQPGIVLEQGRR